MAKGFLNGIFWGGVTSAIGLAGLSLMSALPVPPDASFEPPQAGTSPEVVRAPSVGPATVAGSRPTGAAPSLDTPLPPATNEAAMAATRPAVPPVVGGVPARAQDAAPGARHEAITGLLAPVEEARPQRAAQPVPMAVEALPDSADDIPPPPPPAAAPFPKVATPQQPAAPAQASDGVAAATGLATAPASSSRPAAPAAPRQLNEEGLSGSPAGLAPITPYSQVQSSAPRPQLTLDPDRKETPGSNTPAAAPMLPSREDRAVNPGPPRKPQAPAPTTLPHDDASKPAAPPPKPEREVRVNQLPQLGVARSGSGPVFTSAGPTSSLLSPRGLAPVDRYAMRWDRATGQARLAIVLMDDGTRGESLQAQVRALRGLPFPVSIAVDALLPDATARATAYRDAGFEVLASLDFPTGARARDAEVSIAAALSTMPEVFAVMDGAGAGVQTTLEASGHLAAVLADSGHGFVARNKGLNTALKRALQAGVPSALISREMGPEMTEAEMQQLLNQAAFRAEREGMIALRGSFRAETLEALRSWGTTSRAARVAVVPVSSLLERQP